MGFDLTWERSRPMCNPHVQSSNNHPQYVRIRRYRQEGSGPLDNASANLPQNGLATHHYYEILFHVCPIRTFSRTAISALVERTPDSGRSLTVGGRQGEWAKKLIADKKFWAAIKVCDKVLEPAVMDLRYSDSMRGGNLGLMYNRFLQPDELYSSPIEGLPENVEPRSVQDVCKICILQAYDVCKRCM